VQLDPDASGRATELRVEHMGGERDAHRDNLSA
jgi:hypothetical protein